MGAGCRGGVACLLIAGLGVRFLISSRLIVLEPDPKPQIALHGCLNGKAICQNSINILISY